MDTNTLKRTAIRAAMRLPATLQHMLARSIPHRVDGQELDAQTRLALLLIEKSGDPPLDSLSAQEARAYFDVVSTVFCGPTTAVGHVADADADGIPVRIYTPIGVGASGAAIVYYHGGGAVIGSIETHDDCCRWIAARSGCIVVSVEYRLAPEHKFPAGIDDAITAYGWLCSQADALGIDPARIAVAGDSYGGCLALSVSIAARDGAAPLPRCQLLLYPVADFTFDVPSYTLFGDGYLLSASIMQWFFRHYVHDQSLAKDPRVSPTFAELSGLPTTHVVTAGFDPLRDDGKRLADKLDAAGVTTRYRCHASLIHGFATQVNLIDAATAAMATSVDALVRDL